jgi:hypothetical protein
MLDLRRRQFITVLAGAQWLPAFQHLEERRRGTVKNER